MLRPYWAIKSFKIDPLYKVLSWSNQSLFLPLKSPNTIVKKSFLKLVACNVDSKLVIKLENSFCDWLGDRYRATSAHSLFLIISSMVRNSWKKFLLISFRGMWFPVDTWRRFNIDTTSCYIVRRRINVETTSCVYTDRFDLSWRLTSDRL